MNKISIFYEHMADAAKQSGLTMEDVCAKVKAFGYDAVEIDANRIMNEGDVILPMLEKNGLAVNTIYYFYTFGNGENHMEADKVQAEKILSLCAPVKCKNLLCVPGFLTEEEMDRNGEPYQLRRERMAKAIAYLIEIAAKEGVAVSMEDFDGDTAPFSTASELLWFMQNVPGVGCGFDTGNFQYSEEDAVAVLPDFLPYLTGVHCKDRGWTKNGSDPKITIQDRPMYAVAVGDGDLDMAGMLKTILDTGYTGILAAEHFGSNDQLIDMARSASWLKGFLKGYYGNK